jgi:hypothetical protein
MPVPSYGAMPLAKTFLLVRIMQVVAMLIIIGITSNFVSLIVTTGIEPPKEVVGTLSVVRYNCSTLSVHWTNITPGLHCNPLHHG